MLFMKNPLKQQLLEVKDIQLISEGVEVETKQVTIHLKEN